MSGPHCLEVLARVWQWSGPPHALDHPLAAEGIVRLPGLLVPVPAVLYLWPTARSYTRQPLAELHLPGSPPLLDAVLGALCAAGARLAEPGEFTLRAFLAGRLDLTQAEAVLGVIDAQDRRQLDTALAQLAGGLARPLAELRDELLELLAHVEASLDFADEHLEFLPRTELLARLQRAARHVADLRGRIRGRNLGEPLPRVVLAGRPNAGKSSLFNALVCRYASRHQSAGPLPALVAPVPGTTRDYLTAELDLDGVGCELVDTAGIIAGHHADVAAQLDAATFKQHAEPLARHACVPCPPRPTAGLDEQAQKLAAELRRRACIELWCIDSTRPPAAWEKAELAAATTDRLVVWTKADARAAHGRAAGEIGVPLAALAVGWEQPSAEHQTQTRSSAPQGEEVLITSAFTGQGLPELAARLRAMLLARCTPEGEAVASTAQRAEEHLKAAQVALEAACRLAAGCEFEEFLAVEMRAALDALGYVAGAVYTEDLLDRVFARFCIGK